MLDDLMDALTERANGGDALAGEARDAIVILLGKIGKLET